MKGRITENAVPVYLYTAKYTNYVHFWLENKLISIKVSAEAFKQGLISGSATEDEDRRLSQMTKAYNDKTDSLEKTLNQTKDSTAHKAILSQIRSAEDQSKAAEKDWVRQSPIPWFQPIC